MPMLLFVNRVLSIDLSCSFLCGRVTIRGTTASRRGLLPKIGGQASHYLASPDASGPVRVDVTGTPPHLRSHLSFFLASQLLLVSLPSSYLNFTPRTAATAFSRPPTTVYSLVKTWISRAGCIGGAQLEALSASGPFRLRAK
jgi:hypothetical protein